MGCSAPPAQQRSIRLLLVDDHAVFRTGLRALLEKQRDLAVLGEADSGEGAVTRAQALRPDVILMDLAMPHGTGIEATRQIVALGMGARVIVLTALTRERQLLDALEAGARGFVEKMSPVNDVVRAIRAVMRGEVFLGLDGAPVAVLQRFARETRDPRASAPGLLLRQTMQRS